MANPQKENGYTPISNEIMDALARTRIPGEARQILDVIFRKTYGWNKCEDVISLSQFAEMTGLSKSHVCRGISKLLSMNIITKKGNAISHFTKKGNEYDIRYGIQKDFDKWRTLPKKVTLPKKEIDVAKKGNATLPKKGTTKDTNTKENKQKKKKTFLPPDFVVSDRVKKWAEKKGYKNLEEHLEAFKLTCTAKGYKYLDWDSAFMNAIRNNWARIGDKADDKYKEYGL